MKAVLLTLILFLVFSELPGQTNKKDIDGSRLMKSITTKIRLDSVIITREPSSSREKIHYLYTPEGYNTKCVHYFFIDSTNQWEQSSIDSCTYDSAWNLTSVITDGHIKEEFTYDSTGYLLTKDYIGFKEEYIHDKTHNKTYVQNRFAENCIFYFDSLRRISNVRWAETDSLEFKYYEDGDIISRTHFFRDPPDYPLVISAKDEYYYDSTKNLIISISYKSTETNMFPDGNLYLNGKSEYIYDNSSEYEDLYLPYYSHDFSADRYLGWFNNIWNFFLNYKINEKINYNYSSGQWQLYNRIKYYYSDQTVTGVEELPEKEIRIFPNPATTHITIDFDGIQGPVILELFNGQGQSVMKKSVSSGNSLSVGYLPRGLYMYRLYLQDNMKAGKILLN